MRSSDGPTPSSDRSRRSAAATVIPVAVLCVAQLLFAPFSPSATASPSHGHKKPTTTLPSTTTTKPPTTTTTAPSTTTTKPPSTTTTIQSTTTTKPPTTTTAPSTTTTTIPSGGSGPCGTATSAPSTYAHVIWLWMENKHYADVINNSAAPYQTQLSKQCGTATHYATVGSPSEPNYIGAVAGQTFGIADDNPPSSHVLTADNLFRQVRSLGKTEKSYSESMPSN